MASWTDKAPQFNPYVQQLPVELMAQVGMQKQKQYDEGVQKIQTNIDNIAGLDIGRDVDKVYLQSKLNALGNNLKTVAAGDFSNFQLVNTVNGMTNQLVKDSIIQSAVTSTANDRKQMADMEADKKAGKLTPHAEYYYNLKRSSYYSNTELQDKEGKPVSFNGKYVQSWDIDKNILDAIKAVGDSKWTTENVFKTDGLGNIIKDPKTGAPVYSEYAIKEIREGRFSENVSAAIDGVLARPEAKQELAMRGVYNYRGYEDIDQFIKQYEEQNKTAIRNIETSKFDLMAKFTLEPTKEGKAAIQALINKADSTIESLKNNEDVRITDAREFGDIAAYKAALETRQTKNNYMTSGVTEKTSREYIKSIPYEVGREKINDERDWFAKQQSLQMGWANVNIARENVALSRERVNLEKTKWEFDPKNPQNVLTQPTTEGAMKAVPYASAYTSTIEKGKELSDLHTTEMKDFVRKYLQAINYGNGKSSRDVSDEIVDKQISQWSKSDPHWLGEFYRKAKQKVKSAPNNKYFTDLATHIPKIESTEVALQDHATLISNMNKDATVVAAGEGEMNTAGLIKSISSIPMVYTEGGNFFGYGGIEKTINISPQDIVEFNVLKKEGKEISPRLRTKFGSQASKAYQLSTDPTVYANAYTKPGTFTQSGVKSILELQGKLHSQKFKNVINAKEAYLQANTLGNSPMLYTVYEKGAKTPEINSTNEAIQQVLNTYKAVGGTIGESVSEFSNAFTDKTKAEYSVNIGVDRSGPTDQYTLELYDKGQQVKTIPITAQQSRLIKPGLNPEARASRAQQLVQRSGSKQTTNTVTGNLNSPDAYQGAMYKQNYFIERFNRTDIYGADVKVNGLGQPNLYIYSKNEDGEIIGIPVKGSNSVYPKAFSSVDDAEDFLVNSLSTSGQIDNIINNSK